MSSCKGSRGCDSIRWCKQRSKRGRESAGRGWKQRRRDHSSLKYTCERAGVTAFVVRKQERIKTEDKELPGCIFPSARTRQSNRAAGAMLAGSENRGIGKLVNAV